MHEIQLKRGDIVHINGFPVELKADVTAQTATDPFLLEQHDTKPEKTE